jgi:diguanylate cyclase (GGDEF)-like protein
MNINKHSVDIERRSGPPPFASPDDTAATVRALLDENKLLRATLADARARIVELELLADSDTLTPLPNRRRFLRELDRLIQDIRRHQTHAALLFVDLDRLKTINDTYGHGAGDAALQHVALLLLSQIRGSDLIARLGGDEFGIILVNATAADAIDKAGALCRLIAATPLPLGSRTVPITVSVGCSTIDESSDAQSTLARADGEMYASKQFRRVPTDNSDRSA